MDFYASIGLLGGNTPQANYPPLKLAVYSVKRGSKGENAIARRESRLFYLIDFPPPIVPSVSSSFDILAIDNVRVAELAEGRYER